jgi:hypothetical protein
MSLQDAQVVVVGEPVDPLCVCGTSKCMKGKCWGYNREMNPTKRVKPQQPSLQIASVSPASPKKSVLTATTSQLVGRVAKATHRAAVLKQQQTRVLPEMHSCNHFTTCTEGFCQTCKCMKCKANYQPSGKRPSALRSSLK